MQNKIENISDSTVDYGVDTWSTFIIKWMKNFIKKSIKKAKNTKWGWWDWAWWGWWWAW